MKLDLAYEMRHDLPVVMDQINKTDKSYLQLRPAVFADRRKVYHWLVASDATRSIMGPPDYPDYPVPGWEKFCADYPEHFFLPDGDGYGRMFIICMGGREIGYIGYYGLNGWRGLAEVEICIAASADCGRGWGSSAICWLGDTLLEQPAVDGFFARPSGRNRRAIAAFQKAGFVHYDSKVHKLPGWVFTVGLCYPDAVTLLQNRESSTMSDCDRF